MLFQKLVDLLKPDVGIEAKLTCVTVAVGKDIDRIHEKLKTLEIKTLIPIERGEQGRPGRDGARGRDGVDGRDGVGKDGATGQTTVASSTLAAAPKGTVIHSGPVATRAAPFLNLASGHTGVKDIESVTFAATAYTGAGRLAILLVKPLFVIPVPTAGMHSMTDFVNMMPSLPKLPDGACVKLMAYHTAATTANANFLATGDVVWG